MSIMVRTSMVECIIESNLVVNILTIKGSQYNALLEYYNYVRIKYCGSDIDIGPRSGVAS